MTLYEKVMMKRQRLILGILCMLLPFSVALGFINFEANGPAFWWSISATYYATNGHIMSALLYLTAFYFWAYKGHDKLDKWVTTAMAVSAAGVATFPCDCLASGAKVGVFQIDKGMSHIIHCVSAIVLFLLFAVMVGLIFTRTTTFGTPTPQKKIKNKIFYVCAVIITVFMASQIITSALGIGWMTIVNETFMLEAFGFAWLVKGGFFKKLND